MIEFKKIDNCLVCNTPHSKNLFDFQSKDDNWYSARKCKNCELVYASPQPVLTYEAINEIYASDYYANYYGPKQDYQDRSQTDYYMKCYEKEYAVYSQFIADKPNRKVFDVGCGDGKFLEIFQKHGWNCTGLEPSTTSRKLAMEKGFQVMEVPFLQVNNNVGKFDLIFLDNVIEHINEPKPFIAKAFSLLEPGGIFVLKTPNSNSLNESIETVMLRMLPRKVNNGIMRSIKAYFNQGTGRVHRYGNLHPPVHLAIYNGKSMTTALTQGGFTNDNIH
ncbi:MAG: class I SAM-dependent methyltransferase, partial [Chitinophagaceae bacterium]|nr:class I SAM-dependent methyltransferase [Chitinophagaceae bacterium]